MNKLLPILLALTLISCSAPAGTPTMTPTPILPTATLAPTVVPTPVFPDSVKTWQDENGVWRAVTENGDEYELQGDQWNKLQSFEMSELDKQIFDSATEIDGMKKVMDPKFGVVAKNEKGEITQYWDYNEYNLENGKWREVVREEDGHLVVLGFDGKEVIVYPERITINVNGEELVLNTTARNYMENKIPETPGAKLAIAQELIRLSDEGKVLPKLADDGMTLKDFWVKEKFGNGGVASYMFAIHSTEWEERRQDQLPSAFVLFPHIVDGKVIEGAYDTFTLVMQSDKTIGGYWVVVVDPDKIMPYANQILDNNMFKTGGKSIVTPNRFISQVECEKWLGEGMVETCALAMADVSVVMQAFRSSVESGMIDSRLMSGELVVLAGMSKVAK